jgi:hypothetical protein
MNLRLVLTYLNLTQSSVAFDHVQFAGSSDSTHLISVGCLHQTKPIKPRSYFFCSPKFTSELAEPLTNCSELMNFTAITAVVFGAYDFQIL